MPVSASRFSLSFAVLLVLIAWVSPRVGRGDEVRFSRDVLPILSDRCFHCHGPDEGNREADLRLDKQADAVADRGGYAAISPGRPERSELLARVTAKDADLRMPPPDSHRKPLSPPEIETLRRWIQQGAEWGRHWAFEPPQADLPENLQQHPIDYLVRRRLKSTELKPSPTAPSTTLLRRVSFDLTGLPPTAEQLDQFLADDSPHAYQRYVDRLLASPHYGERMAMWWLDAARYSDTDGYQQDATRTNWPWRDWVIQAFNCNQPFDQFTIEQFAGDLLPDATDEQRLATAMHRNHMTNGEGGRDPEESRIDYVIDRVNTTGSVWLGLTLGCAQCHSHKFDPISQQDYYRLFAYFNNIDEDGRAGGAAKPYLKYQSSLTKQPLQQAELVVKEREVVLQKVRAEAEKQFDAWLAEQRQRVSKGGFQPWRPLNDLRAHSVEGTELKREADGAIQATGPNPRQDDYWVVGSSDLPRITGWRLEVLPHESHTEGKLSRGESGEFILTDVKLQVRRRGQSQVRDVEIASAIADVEKGAKGRNYGKVRDTLDDDPRNGWTTESHDPKQPHVAVFALAEPLNLAEDEELIFVLLHRSTRGDANLGRFRITVTDQPGQAVRSLQPMPLQSLSEWQASLADGRDESLVPNPLKRRLLDQFLADHKSYQETKSHLQRAKQQSDAIRKAARPLNVMVLADRQQPRTSHVLVRGVWDKKGEVVAPATPDAIFNLDATPSNDVQSPSDPSPATRLQLARWIVHEQNPLTARVIANHLWQLCFGAGLVRTPEDFGLQGERPTHPEVLDWLALELVEHDWDVKHLLRQIVTSETYRQSSQVSPQQLELDPENRLLARGPRFRLPAWMIRDAALQSSGLLNPTVGGPPVMPYQPPGVWAEMFMGRFQYRPSQGPLQFRRTIYAFWRRAAAPTFLFDSAQRRVCEVRPRRTNTPLHALTLMNDLSMLEASRALATQAVSRKQVDQRLPRMFKAVLSRSPDGAELKVLRREFKRALSHYRQAVSDAAELLRFGQPELQPELNPADEKQAELAAYLVVASMILNLDEAITHE